MSEEEKKLIEDVLKNDNRSLDSPKMRNLLHQFINLTDMLDVVRDNILKELRK